MARFTWQMVPIVGSTATVPAQVCAGLAMHAAQDGSHDWLVTHAITGQVLARCGGPEQARRAVQALLLVRVDDHWLRWDCQTPRQSWRDFVAVDETLKQLREAKVIR